MPPSAPPRSLSLAAIGAVLPVAAQTGAWPERPIRVVLPFPPGGPSDIVMRQAAEKMQVALKQPIVIDNKPGAGGNLGTAEVARPRPTATPGCSDPIRWSR